MPEVLVSAASARQTFHGCEPDYIRDVCFGACCRTSAGPILVTLLPSEQGRWRSLGHTVSDGGLLEPEARRCPAQTDTNLCGIHGSPDKPFGCIASPFMLTSRDTLIVRNRYRLLRCFRDGRMPAYEAFRGSLDLLFGARRAEGLCAHLRAGGGDVRVEMPEAAYEALHLGDSLKKAAAAARSAS